MAILEILGFGGTSIAQTEKPAAGEVCTLKVEGMACSVCASRTKGRPLKIDGMKAANVSQP